MIKNKLPELLKSSGVSIYALAKRAGQSYSGTYRAVARPDLSYMQLGSFVAIWRALEELSGRKLLLDDLVEEAEVVKK